MADSLSRFEGESGGAADSISIMNFGLALIQIGGGALPKDEVTALLNDDERKRQSNNAAERVVANGMVQWRRLLPRLVEMLLAADERRWRACFDKWDRNHDGRLTIRELEAAMASLGRVGNVAVVDAPGQHEPRTAQVRVAPAARGRTAVTTRATRERCSQLGPLSEGSSSGAEDRGQGPANL